MNNMQSDKQNAGSQQGNSGNNNQSQKQQDSQPLQNDVPGANKQGNQQANREQSSSTDRNIGQGGQAGRSPTSNE